MTVAATTIGNECDILSGYAWRSSKFNRDGLGLPIIRIQNVDAVTDNEFVYWNEPYDDRFVIEKGDVLLTLSGSFRIECWDGPNGLLNQRIIKIMPKESVHTPWLLYALRNRLLQIEKMGRHALVNNVSVSDIRNLKIKLPPLDDQKRIAEVLDRAEALRARRRAALALLDELTQSIFLEMFGDPVGNPKEWEMRSLQESGVETKTGPFGSLLHKSEYISGGIPLVNPKHMVKGQVEHSGDETVSEEKAKRLSAYRLKTGDVLMARRGEMGRCVVVQSHQNGWLCGTGSFFIRAPKSVYLAEFLELALSSEPMRTHLENMSGRAIMPSLSGKQIKSLRLPVPPIETQQLFVNILEKHNEVVEAQRHHMRLSDSLFASLQSRAFKGELLQHSLQS